MASDTPILFTDKTYAIIGDPGVMGNRIHTKLVYQDTRQAKHKSYQIISKYLSDDSVEVLSELDLDNETRDLLAKYLLLTEEDNWYELTIKYFTGMAKILSREIDKADPVSHQNLSLEHLISTTISIYSYGDMIEIDAINESTIEINYIAFGSHPSGVEYSPSYNGKFESFRDTQCTFILNFDTGLCSWIYLNVQPELRNRGIGTALVRELESMALELGFRRFSVEWPNRGYWIKYLQYELDEELLFYIREDYAYTIEMYKEKD